MDSDAQVLDHHAAKIVGLYAAGEMVGGIFYFNYPNGAGYARRDRAEDHRRWRTGAKPSTAIVGVESASRANWTQRGIIQPSMTR